MTSQKFIKFLITLIALSLLVAIPALAQGPGEEPVDGSGDEGVQNSAPADVEQDAPVESTDGAVDEGVQNSAPADAESTNVEEAGGAVEEFDSVGLESLGSAVNAAEDVDASGALPGSYTSDIIAVANLNSTGTAGSPSLDLLQIGGAGTDNVSPFSVFPGGVSFIPSSEISQGEYSGILSSDFPAAVAVLISNSTAKVADMYKGFNESAVSTESYGTLIFNKHGNFESTFYCQNAGTSAATISAALYKDGSAAVVTTLTSASLAAGAGVKWDIADDAAVQAAWPGAQGAYGYVKFTSANKIACVVDNERMKAPYVQALYNAVPTTGFASTDLRIPLVFNGHGSSSSNVRGLKFNTGISIVNVNGTAANVTVKYSTGTYSNNCTATVPANGSLAWQPDKAGVSGNAFTCTDGALKWPNAAPTIYSFGSVTLTSDQPVLALANSNKYDSGDTSATGGLGAGYSSQGASPSAATTKAVCPLAYNKGTADWATGIQAANVGTAATDITFKAVKAGVDPAGAGNSVTLTGSFTGVAAGGSATAQLFQAASGAPANFEGAVFVSSSGSPIAVSSSSTNYTTLGAAALYDCINY